MNVKIALILIGLSTGLSAQAWGTTDSEKTQRLFLALYGLPVAESSLPQIASLVKPLVRLQPRKTTQYLRVGCDRLQDIDKDFMTPEYGAARRNVQTLQKICYRIIMKSKLSTTKKGAS